jgi:putative endopeptidase
VIVRQPDYLKTLDGALIEVPLQTWKDYLTFGTIAAYADYLPAAFVEAQFQFNGTVIDLRAENQPRWKRGVETTEGHWATPSGASTSSATSRAMRRPASMR